MPTSKVKPSIYQLKITLLGIDPPIWRRIKVPRTMLLSRLHDILQTVMGWTDSHVHQFEKDGKYWGVPETDEVGDLELLDETKVPVSKVFKNEGDSMSY